MVTFNEIFDTACFHQGIVIWGVSREVHSDAVIQVGISETVWNLDLIKFMPDCTSDIADKISGPFL